MDAYHRMGEHRITPAGVLEHLGERTGSTPVIGFSAIEDLGDAVAGGERVAGFMETHDHREWIVPLAARRGLTWKTAPVPAGCRDHVTFLLSIGFGNGSPLPQPSGSWDLFVNGRFALAVRVVKHSQLWRGEECTLAFAANRIEAAEPGGSLCLSSVLTAESFAAFGPALLTVPASWGPAGAPALLRVAPSTPIRSTRWFQMATAPAIAHQSDIYRAVDLLDPERAPRAGCYRILFGDIHTHSGEVDGQEGDDRGCGMGSRLANYRYARGPGGLDFYALTDHEWQVAPDRVAQYLGLAEEFNEDGRFVCLPAFEFTSLLYGHRNVYFRGAGGTVVNSTAGWGRPTMDPAQALTPDDLWDALAATGVPAITVPHHPSATSHPCSWDFHRPEFDRLAEVYSCWGSSEYYGDFPRGITDRFRTLTVRDALNRGLRFGMVASADGHDGHPGDAQSPLVKHHHLFHPLGSGLTAVLAEEQTRASIFDALYARRCYATTGVPIHLWVDLNGAPMGSEVAALPAGRRPRLRVSCRGANGIDHLRIVKNGRVVETVWCHGEPEAALEWEDAQYAPDAPACYTIRVVQVDRESAWSSPVWVG